jgi:hypothetical protein
MAIEDNKIMSIIGGTFCLGVLFQFLGCWLWGNWWPLLTAFAYVLVPMPYLFFGGGPQGSNLSSGWIDAGKFLVGLSATATIAIPSILYHAGKIALGALWMEIFAVILMGGALLAYDFFSERDGGGGFYSRY